MGASGSRNSMFESTSWDWCFMIEVLLRVEIDLGHRSLPTAGMSVKVPQNTKGRIRKSKFRPAGEDTSAMADNDATTRLA